MKNFTNLLKTLEGHTDTDTLFYLINDFRGDIIETLKNIRHNNTTRKQAVKGYAVPDKLEKIQDHQHGLYCDGVTALSLSGMAGEYNPDNEIVKLFLAELKKERRPVSLLDSFDYSIAAARCDGWRQGATSHIVYVDGFMYNLSLIAKVYNCIADPKEYNGCKLELTNDRYPALLMSSRYGLGLVLPINGGQGIDMTPGHSDIDKIEKKIIEAVKASA